MTDQLFEDPDSLFADSSGDGSAERAAALEEAREELRKRLPELRKLPGFPNGTDEDIIAMSYPPYYTACPNPFIGDWLEGLDRPSDEGRVDPGPFAVDISEGKGHLFYKAHSYPTKVPHAAIMRFLLHYTKPGDVVLDGFAGTGMTGVAAQACGNPDPKTKAAIEAEFGSTEIEWGTRRSILGDLGPSATFIEAGLNLPIDPRAFDTASTKLLERFNDKYGWMYKTTVTREQGEPFEADIDFTLWSEVFTCPHCGAEVVFYDAAFNPEIGKVNDEFSCGGCGAELTKDRLEPRKVSVRTLSGALNEKLEMRPILISWRAGQQTGTKRVDLDDLARLEKVLAEAPPWFPAHELPWLHRVHNWAIPEKGFRRANHFWPDRALLALSALWSLSAGEPDQSTKMALRFWIEQAFWGLSWMNRYKANDHSQVNRNQSGVYYVPSLMTECSVRYNLVGSSPPRGKRQNLIKVWTEANWNTGSTVITTGSSTSLPVPDASVDYVFVDPPFGENLYYSDLAYLGESWHRVYTAVAEEAIVDKNKERPKSEDDYGVLISRCFAEFFRVLKPGRWMTVEFSNSSNSIWSLIQNALASAGFVVADTRVIDKEQLSFSQVTAVNAVKHDLVISAYKPAEETEHSFEIAAGSADGAWTFVREHLSRIPATEGAKGQALVVRERQADRIYERMVGYHVARNTLVPVTAAEFYTGLEQRFPVRDSMYFLPDQVEAYERFRITFKELAAQTLFIRDESTAVQWLRQTLKDRPRAFADIQPVFMREMQSSVATWEEMPDLREMLEGNFILDDKSRWCVPDPKKTEHLDQLRTRALLNEFGSYTSGKGPLSRFRTEAVRAGFKAAWATKDYATIVTVGNRLPSDVFVEDSALLHYFRNAEKLAS
jgi:hypothetical protein